MEQLASIIHLDKEVKLVRGVDDQVQKLTSNFRTIEAVLEDAERKQLKDVAVRDWLDVLKDTCYDINDMLDEWKTSLGKLQINASKPLRKVSSFIPFNGFCSRSVMNHDFAHKLKDLNGKLDVIIARGKNEFKFSLSTRGTVELKQPVNISINDYVHNVTNIHGRDHERDTLLMVLLNENSQAPAIPIISIVGIGGIGKTTLARLAFNDDKVNTHFDKKIWVCVSKPFNEIKIVKEIFKLVVGDASKLDQLKTMLEEISDSLIRKKFLLVLDDVWYEDPFDWGQLKDSFKFASPRSRILVTTRNENFANSLGTTEANMISLGLLSEKESWSLFSQIAFCNRQANEKEELEDVGRKILEKCKGLPLAIKVIGSLLCFKNSFKEWQSVLDSEIWELKEEKRGIFPPLLLSYYDLPSRLRKCLSYCVIFSKNSNIEKERLIKLWMAESYLKEDQTKDLELIGQEYFENLAMHSFFQDFKKNKFDGRIESCKMHDIVHYFVQFLTKNECFSIDIDDFEKSEAQFSSERAQYLMVELKSGESFPRYMFNAKNARSLLVKFEKMRKVTATKLFENFACLRRLELICFDNDLLHSKGMGIKELPSEIAKLIHLRYLDLSGNKRLEKLPEALCELYNLQTLNLNYCSALKRLPQEMGKLINLRHLLNYETCYCSLSEMPKGIEGLTCLWTLTEFVVCRNRQGTRPSNLEYLKNLNSIEGSLHIIGLGEVGNVSEVNKANLMNKRNLISLGLYFRRDDEVRENRNGVDEAVSEALQPPPNLETLGIGNYEGKTLSLNWMVSLTKLKFLTFWKCINWEEWEILKQGNEDIAFMPSLYSLTIDTCKKLKSLPEYILQIPTLKQLKITGCPILKERYNKKTGVDRSKISHIPDVQI